MTSANYWHGARPLDEKRSAFRLWAPDASDVSLQRPGLPPLPMQAAADGWFEVQAECPAGCLYRFTIDGRLDIPDPASRCQSDGPHGYSRVIDTAAFGRRGGNWRGRPWHEAVIYELHVGAAGGYAAIRADLPRLVKLGITAIELMPLAELPGGRNWGYDGVLPYAPHAGYGPPEALVALIDDAHAHGLMVYLDVVYNHFGPDGNYLGSYASGFFRHDQPTPWGDAIDFRRREVREFFIDNALMWLRDYRFDGLRLDAVHAIGEPDFLIELAERIRVSIEPERHVHLMLENEDNSATLLECGFDAQWNDDGHNALHVLLTGEKEGYYADFSEQPVAKLARCLSEGFVYQGERSRRGEPRGEPSAHLPPSVFVLFLQNHDQIGNRAFGERLNQLCSTDALRAAVLLQLLCPMIPLLFMGEEWAAPEPFLFFTDHHDELADAVCAGRRAEFAEFAVFADPASRERIPDPNAATTFERSRPDPARRVLPEHQAWLDYYRELLQLRHQHIAPHLPDCRSLGCELLGERALRAHWKLGNGARLSIELNLAESPLDLTTAARGGLLQASSAAALNSPLVLPGHSARAFLEPAHE